MHECALFEIVTLFPTQSVTVVCIVNTIGKWKMKEKMKEPAVNDANVSASYE